MLQNVVMQPWDAAKMGINAGCHACVTDGMASVLWNGIVNTLGEVRCNYLYEDNSIPISLDFWVLNIFRVKLGRPEIRLEGNPKR